MIKLLERNAEGKFQYHSDDHNDVFFKEEHFKGQHFFYEFFDGNNGKGLGASNQTGWTALIANLILELDEDKNNLLILELPDVKGGKFFIVLQNSLFLTLFL